MRPTLVFYTVWRQTILLVKWRVLPLNGLICSKKEMKDNETSVAEKKDSYTGSMYYYCILVWQCKFQ